MLLGKARWFWYPSLTHSYARLKALRTAAWGELAVAQFLIGQYNVYYAQKEKPVKCETEAGPETREFSSTPSSRGVVWSPNVILNTTKKNSLSA